MRAERLDELEALAKAVLAADSDLESNPHDTDKFRVAMSASRQLDIYLTDCGMAQTVLDLIRTARAVSEWREADAAWQTARANPSSTPDLLDRTLRELRAAEARLRGTGGTDG